MTSSWGNSWGYSWGSAWGSIQAGSPVYYWTGYEWNQITAPPKIFNGSIWVSLNDNIKTFDGTNWN